MIVYAGKQYWNKFNNWDEALFQDANRPRDNDMFKLRPWLQSDKWKWREANKDTDFSYIMLKWWSTVPWTWSWKQLLWKVPKLQRKWTDSEVSIFPSMAWVSTRTMNMEQEWNPYVIIKNGDISYQTWDGWTGFTTETIKTDYFEIAKTWLYYVCCYWIFWFDSSYYDSSTSYQYKERVGIAQNDGWVFVAYDRTQARACGNGDAVKNMQMLYLVKWSQILPMVAHSFTSWTNTVFWTISLTRMW